jgi:hypothetical protein
LPAIQRAKVGSTPVLMYDYRIVKENNVAWAWKLHGREFMETSNVPR